MQRTIHCDVEVEAPFDLVARWLAEDSFVVLRHDDTVGDESDEGVAGQLRRRLAVEFAGVEVGREVRVEVGPFDPRGVRHAAVGLRWHAERGRQLFPELDADLEVTATSLHPPRTRIAVHGVYEPPFGAVGGVADRLLLHQVAEATLRRFATEVGERLSALIADMPDDERL